MNASVDPATTGGSNEMYAIAAVVLGGISMAGGRGKCIGILFGVLSYTIIDKIIVALKMNTLIQDGVKGAILPLVFGTVPFYTRQVEVAISGVDKGKIEAARSMGSGTVGLIFRVYLHEAVPELIRVTTVTAISLIGLTTMAGAVGAGGIGSFAINYGQNQHYSDIVNVCVLILLLVVFALQSLGNFLARRTTNRSLFHKKH